MDTRVDRQLIDACTHFLEGQLDEWNSLDPTELKHLQARPLSCDPQAVVSFVTEHATSFGYEYVELEITKPTTFSIRALIEGRAGGMSTRAYLPVVEVFGNRSAALEWLTRLGSRSR